MVGAPDAGAPLCDQGHLTTYCGAIRAYRCEWRGLVRADGTVVTPCGATNDLPTDGDGCGKCLTHPRNCD